MASVEVVYVRRAPQRSRHRGRTASHRPRLRVPTPLGVRAPLWRSRQPWALAAVHDALDRLAEALRKPPCDARVASAEVEQRAVTAARALCAEPPTGPPWPTDRGTLLRLGVCMAEALLIAPVGALEGAGRRRALRLILAALRADPLPEELSVPVSASAVPRRCRLWTAAADLSATEWWRSREGPRRDRLLDACLLAGPVSADSSVDNDSEEWQAREKLALVALVGAGGVEACSSTSEDQVLLRRLLAQLAPARRGSTGAHLARALLRHSDVLQALVRSHLVRCKQKTAAGSESKTGSTANFRYSAEAWRALMTELESIPLWLDDEMWPKVITGLPGGGRLLSPFAAPAPQPLALGAAFLRTAGCDFSAWSSAGSASVLAGSPVDGDDGCGCKSGIPLDELLRELRREMSEGSSLQARRSTCWLDLHGVQPTPLSISTASRSASYVRRPQAPEAVTAARAAAAPRRSQAVHASNNACARCGLRGWPAGGGPWLIAGASPEGFQPWQTRKARGLVRRPAGPLDPRSVEEGGRLVPALPGHSDVSADSISMGHCACL
eukprot:gnl/TRDRNA2_/TRDRNA2_80813_c0_seq1.p1 gnl/TRDRNA2_/TRDRNA2_80813_c0~~gnl/TRDRNA2_/TRDRNA2_80813_c0_seq1.p1  ORF type:complete len:555 (+),score=57.51 gnl/TRDRNA2_/TRDRNA2_80813_c0_seq1:55-1719(+)